MKAFIGVIWNVAMNPKPGIQAAYHTDILIAFR
jgi:hypothetical protein